MVGRPFALLDDQAGHPVQAETGREPEPHRAETDNQDRDFGNCPLCHSGRWILPLDS
jgi:hypothetical protein